MKTYHIIYLSVYSFFKKIASKYTFDSPETYAFGLLSLLVAFSSALVYHLVFKQFDLYSEGTSANVFLGTLVLSFSGQYYYYVHKENFLKVKSNYKGYTIVGGLLFCLWVFLPPTGLSVSLRP